MKKRILILSTAYYPFVGGAEVAIKEITSRLANKYDFDLVTSKLDYNLPDQEKIDVINVYRLGKTKSTKLNKLYLAFFSFNLIKKLLKKNNYTCVWIVMASYNSLVVKKIKSEFKIKVLLTLQEGDPLDYIERKMKLFKKQFKQVFQQADILQAISSYLLDWGLLMGFDKNNKKAVIIPNGVDVKKFQQPIDKETKKDIRLNCGFTEQDFVLITASRLVAKNGVEDIIKSLQFLPKKVKLMICGTGILENKLKKIINDLGLKSRVCFTGQISHDKLPSYLKASDVFVRPSLSEGLGNAFLEAMASRILVIGTLVGGIRDFLKSGQTGFVCKPQNPESISNKVMEIMSLNTEEKKKILDKAEEMVISDYDWSKISQQMTELFDYEIKT